MVNTYISPYDYVRSPSGLESASLIGNLVRLNGTYAAGTVNISVTSALTVVLNQYDPITIFDGPNSEVVTVGFGGALIGATSVPISALAVGHAIGTPLCSPGTQGDLGGEILKASAWMENVTKQVLWSTTQTENLKMPTMRASLDNQGALTFRTKQYPITAIASLYLGTLLSNLQQYDQAQAIIDVNELVSVPELIPVSSGGAGGGGNNPYVIYSPPFQRNRNAWCQVTYTAGYTAANMPADIRDAAVLRTSALLSRRDNPIGADSIREGAGSIQATMRGDNSPYSLLSKESMQILQNYSLRIF